MAEKCRGWKKKERGDSKRRKTADNSNGERKTGKYFSEIVGPSCILSKMKINSRGWGEAGFNAMHTDAH